MRALATALVIALAATPFTGGVNQPLLAAAVLAFTTLIFSALGTIVGVWADTFDQHSFVTAIVVTPLALLGGVFYSARTLEEPWSTLTQLDRSTTSSTRPATDSPAYTKPRSASHSRSPQSPLLRRSP